MEDLNKGVNQKAIDKQKAKIKTTRIIAFVLFGIQILGYVTLKSGQTEDWTAATWIGFHIWAIIGIILLIRTSNKEAKLNQSPNP